PYGIIERLHPGRRQRFLRSLVLNASDSIIDFSHASPRPASSSASSTPDGVTETFTKVSMGCQIHPRGCAHLLPAPWKQSPLILAKYAMGHGCSTPHGITETFSDSGDRRCAGQQVFNACRPH